ncbi:glycerate kinase [Maribacter sp. 2308TA10-17]|uniref:glycerate kinase n=1 Tax=Maribacter sp. 2308TA10-17 TaxID=3386276 RepID=UPI0039BD35C8
MKIVIAPDKFKGSLTGFEFCNAVEKGLKNVISDIEIIKMPLADGGDGTAEVVKYYLEGEKVTLKASDPLFRSINTWYVYSKKEKIAYIEMAEISGLQLLQENERNSMYTTSLGTGQLIVDAMEKGVKQIILGIGGSATNDGGMGMAKALGYQFLDENDQELKPVGCNLQKVKEIDASNIHPKLREVEVVVACDVSNPFYGKSGAAHVYAAQKGASKEEIVLLDDGLRNFAKVVSKKFDIDLQEISGSGAAGGMGGGALIFLKGQLHSGIEIIKELANFDKTIANADWIITGEGKLDNQTLSGKTISGVLKSAKAKNIPVAALCGAVTVSNEDVEVLGLDYIDAISKNCKNLEEAISNVYPNLVESAIRFGKSLKVKP